MEANEYKMVQEDMLSQLDSIKATLLKKAGVIAVGIGVKERRGEFTEEISIRVFVGAKRPLKDIAPEDVIPPVIEGFKTDVILPYVIQEEAFVEREDTHDYRPIKGGIAIGSEINPSPYGGTLGWFGKLADNTPILLTNFNFSGIDSQCTVIKHVFIRQQDRCIICQFSKPT